MTCAHYARACVRLPACAVLLACVRYSSRVPVSIVAAWRAVRCSCSTGRAALACAGLRVYRHRARRVSISFAIHAGSSLAISPALSLRLLSACARLLQLIQLYTSHCYQLLDSDTPRSHSPALAVRSTSGLLACLASSPPHCVLLAALRIAYSLYLTVTLIYSLIYKEF